VFKSAISLFYILILITVTLKMIATKGYQAAQPPDVEFYGKT
jgi:hypothetical protein